MFVLFLFGHMGGLNESQYLISGVQIMATNRIQKDIFTLQQRKNQNDPLCKMRFRKDMQKVSEIIV